jgi:hypothetical protein
MSNNILLTLTKTAFSLNKISNHISLKIILSLMQLHITLSYKNIFNNKLKKYIYYIYHRINSIIVINYLKIVYN